MPTAIPADTTNGPGIGRSACSARSGTDATVSRAVTSRTVPASTRGAVAGQHRADGGERGERAREQDGAPDRRTAVGNANAGRVERVARRDADEVRVPGERPGASQPVGPLVHEGGDQARQHHKRERPGAELAECDRERQRGPSEDDDAYAGSRATPRSASRRRAGARPARPRRGRGSGAGPRRPTPRARIHAATRPITSPAWTSVRVVTTPDAGAPSQKSVRSALPGPALRVDAARGGVAGGGERHARDQECEGHAG